MLKISTAAIAAVIGWLVLASPAAGLWAIGGDIEERGGEVNRRDDGADLRARDGEPGNPGGEDGGGEPEVCSSWTPLLTHQLPGVPKKYLIGVDPEQVWATRTTAGYPQTLHTRTCPANPVDPFEYEWFDDIPELRDLVEEATERLTIPLPEPDFAPPAHTVQTLVGIDVWFWIPEADWQPIERSATAGTVTVTATATPLDLRFDPGNNDETISCEGPGTPWQSGAVTDCSYIYQWISAHHPTGQWPANVTTQWEITWTATTGHAGILEPIELTTQTPLTVNQVEAVLRR